MSGQYCKKTKHHEMLCSALKNYINKPQGKLTGYIFKNDLKLHKEMMTKVGFEPMTSCNMPALYQLSYLVLYRGLSITLFGVPVRSPCCQLVYLTSVKCLE